MNQSERTDGSNARYPKLLLSGASINYLRWSNLWMTVWWGLSFPGFGQWYQGRYFSGLVLIAWEFFINLKSNLNEAIYDTMLGRFEEAKLALDQRWFLLYIAIYIFAVWDGYYTGMELNRRTLLAENEPQQMANFIMNGWSVGYLAVRDPRLGVIWSLLVPGAGHFWLQRKLLAIFFFACWVITAYNAGLPQGALATLLGDWEGVLRTLNPQWLLFAPSLYLFACYDTFASACRLNELFMEEQGRYIQSVWGSPLENQATFLFAEKGSA